MRANESPLLIAIVGGSGSGKSWLADKLQSELGATAARLSLDDFYRDLFHLPPERRALVNFDEPRAIDWAALEDVLRLCVTGRAASVPRYDFKSHCRLRRPKTFKPKPIILVDGLWLLRRRSIRRLFDLSIFLHCASGTRLRRRLARDLLSRGRTRTSVRQQFRTTVEPMHRRYVTPQARLADIVFRAQLSERWVQKLAELLRSWASTARMPEQRKDFRLASVRRFR
jgi:uridine kinase